MQVLDRDDQPVGIVQLVYYGGASDAAIERATQLTEEDVLSAAAAEGLVISGDVGEVTPEMRARMMRDGYIRIEGPGISPTKSYIMPEQIANVAGNDVQLHVSQAELQS